MLKLVSFGTAPSELVEEGQAESETGFWLPLSGRSDTVLSCETCSAEWDVRADEMTLVRYTDDSFGVGAQYKTLSLEEWARLAAKLPLDAGNVVCDPCQADYFVEHGKITLIDAPHDPHGFLARYQGRLLRTEQIPWLGVGKASGAPGLICAECDTELDFDGDYLRLRHTTHESLRRHVDTARPLEDWKRIAMRLPTQDEEPAFYDRFMLALRSDVIEGAIPWDGAKDSVRWRGTARRLDEDGEITAKGRLEIADDLLEFSARSRSVSLPLDALIEASEDSGAVTLRFAGQPAPVILSIEPVELQVELTSGTYDVVLVAEDFMKVVTSGQMERATTF